MNQCWLPEDAVCAVIVAHPDDETLWAGGTILLHPRISWVVATLCRKSDPDRSTRFYRAMKHYGASGVMADLDDGPEQKPLADGDIRQAVLGVLPRLGFDYVLTHGERGEYTRHRRHEETARAVEGLWKEGRLGAKRIFSFAYEDGGGRYPPRAAADADLKVELPDETWELKKRVIRDIYGFRADSFEASATQRIEGFSFLDRAGPTRR
jgi:LmbE family N-acetylglucosaminyl deacetylase